MEFLVRIFVEIIFEVLAYNTGYYLWSIVPSKIQVEPIVKQKRRKKRDWFTFTYSRGNTKYLFHDSIALIGLSVWFAVGVIAYSIFRVYFNQ